VKKRVLLANIVISAVTAIVMLFLVLEMSSVRAQGERVSGTICQVWDVNKDGWRTVRCIERPHVRQIKPERPTLVPTFEPTLEPTERPTLEPTSYPIELTPTVQPYPLPSNWLYWWSRQ